jgi:outer membrane protein insertion porin family
VLGDEPVGGNWLFLLGSEYNVPLYQDVFRGVLFIDSGTVQKDIGFDRYRLAVGAGVRIKIPFLGQAPFALDFAFPIAEQNGDDTQVFSFDLAVPF